MKLPRHPNHRIPATALASVLAASTLLTSLDAAPEAKVERIYPALKYDRPVQVTIPPDGTNRRFLVQQKGIVYILPKDESASDAKVFLDLTNRPLIENDFEEGLLNLSFHPDFKDNGKFYVYHTIQHPKRSRVTEFKVSATDPDSFDPESERVLLEVPQPFWNHNSGNMLFGPDGFLYVFIGDGGKRDDPHRLAQNLWVLNGKALRLDVDSRSGDLAYGIPEDNPFAKSEGVRPEIWAYGLRNPWGVAFDGDGRLWCADVGQDLYEELNIIEKGGNYGWNYREGLHPFVRSPGEPPKEAAFIDPIHEYPRSDGLSITGGVVYRGKGVPSLSGYYVYGDYVVGTLWALRYEDGKVTENVVLRPPSPDQPFKPTAFCEDENGEVLVLSWDGSIYRLVP